MMTTVKTPQEIAAMRTSGKMLATILQLVNRAVEPGVTTKYLADLARKELEALGGKPTFLGYQGYPDVMCISVNDQVVHGIPSDRVLEAGDIVGLDFGVTYDGMVTDSAISTIVGGKALKPQHQQLVDTTKRALDAGIAAVHNDVRTGDIGAAIQAVLEKGKFGIVRDMVGHGVGHHMHEDPNIPNYGRPNTGPWLKAGMTIAIEPMATLGTERIYVAEDNWTIVTQDSSWSAHFEHSILITEEGSEILTTL